MSFYPETAAQNIKTVHDDILIKIKLAGQIFLAYRTSVTLITTPKRLTLKKLTGLN